jgi:hypothetical protein
VNAVSLLVMIAIAIAFLLVWRTDRPLEAVLDAVRREPGTPAPFEALDVRSGVYERARAAPLLFVRGQVLSRATRAVSAVTVAVEVVRAGQVLARGEAVAGAVPTAEELHEAADPAALARAAHNAAARAPRTVRPGEAVPFLVAIGDAPADLEGASLRVAISPLGRATP